MHGVGEDLVDGEVGKAVVGVDPIGEEPGEILAGRGGFQGRLKRRSARRSFASCFLLVAARVRRAKSGAERIVADQVAQHPEDVGGLGAVVDGRGGAGEGLTCTFAGAGRLCKCQRLAARFKCAKSLIAMVLVVIPETCP